MSLRIVPYTTELEAAVKRFNSRMEAARAAAEFGIPGTAPLPRERTIVCANYFVAVDSDQEVRGGIIVLEHPASVGGAIETVLNLQSPLSEGIIDPKFSLVGAQLARFALKRSPYVYVVGMGNEANPLPRLLRALGWKVRHVPFYFRLLNPRRCLTELRPLQNTPSRRLGARFAAHSGLGWLAVNLRQGRSVPDSGYTSETTIGSDSGDDDIWNRFRDRCSFAVVRDSSTMPLYCRKDVARFRVSKHGERRGWFSLLIAQMRDDRYFGNLKIATLVDVLGMESGDIRNGISLAVGRATAAECDLVITNQLHAEVQEALPRAGFMAYSSNYLFATSKALTERMQDTSALVTRQDGDGLVNLVSPERGS